MIIFQFSFGIFYLFMLKVTSSEKFSFQSYQNKNLVHKNKTTNNNANVAAVLLELTLEPREKNTIPRRSLSHSTYYRNPEGSKKTQYIRIHTNLSTYT